MEKGKLYLPPVTRLDPRFTQLLRTWAEPVYFTQAFQSSLAGVLGRSFAGLFGPSQRRIMNCPGCGTPLPVNSQDVAEEIAGRLGKAQNACQAVGHTPYKAPTRIELLRKRKDATVEELRALEEAIAAIESFPDYEKLQRCERAIQGVRDFGHL